MKALNIPVATFNAADDITAADFFTDGDAYVLASYTDGDYTVGNGALPDTILDFADDLKHFDLSGKKVAVLGTGDTSYDQFCAAVDVFVDLVKAGHGQLVGTPVKINLEPDDTDLARLKDLAEAIQQVIA